MTTLSQKLVRILLTGVIPLVFLITLLLTTNPYHLPIVLLVLPFLLIFFITYQGISLLFSKSRLTNNKKKQKVNASLFAGAIVTLALLESIRQLSWRDLIIITILIVGLSFYIRRVNF